MWPYILTEEQIKNKIISVCTEYLKERESTISPKKYIYLLDNKSCIPHFRYNNEEISIFNDTQKYRYFFHENLMVQYTVIKKEISKQKKNALIVMDRKDLLLTESLSASIHRIEPKKLIDNCCKLELFEFTNLSSDINDISFLMWESIDFIVENIMRYKDRDKLEDKHLIEIVFNYRGDNNIQQLTWKYDTIVGRDNSLAAVLALISNPIA